MSALTRQSLPSLPSLTLRSMSDSFQFTVPRVPPVPRWQQRRRCSCSLESGCIAGANSRSLPRTIDRQSHDACAGAMRIGVDARVLSEAVTGIGRYTRELLRVLIPLRRAEWMLYSH